MKTLKKIMFLITVMLLAVSASLAQKPAGKEEVKIQTNLDCEMCKKKIEDYMAREVLPHVPDAWVDESKTKIGYEINFNRYFYKYTPPRPLNEIEADLKAIEKDIADMLAEVTE